MDILQFYPTPPALVERAWRKFRNRHFTRVLEPSAGRGDLMGRRAKLESWQHRAEITWDAVEIDATHHPMLRQRGATVVGFDFLDLRMGSIYSHIVMNPPFARGAEHVLHAWDILFTGEIVAILNAETLRNPYTRERQLLARLVAQHGSVEYISDAFKGPDVEREADVEVALVYLCKEVDASTVVGDVLEELAQERGKASDRLNLHHNADLMLPRGFVEDLVDRFDAAVRAARAACEAETRANYYARLLGQTMEERNRKVDPDALAKENAKDAPEAVRNRFDAAYDKLKSAGWAGVLRSTEVLKRLSSEAQKRMERDFAAIKGLEFTAANIYGFLQGLAEQATSIQMSMVCDVFDAISRYHAENTVFYMGWKSNTRHRTAGMRLKTTRFVLPGHQTHSYSTTLDFDSCKLLSDFDKVFAMLDGKREPEISLNAVFEKNFRGLRSGERHSSSYFDVRYYPGRGTIHFFPRRPDLMERLNRVVGQQRQWLPPNLDEAPTDFKKQYEKADKFDRAVRDAFKQEVGPRLGRRVDLSDIFYTARDEHQAACTHLGVALEKVLKAQGINPFPQLEATPQQQLLLAA